MRSLKTAACGHSRVRREPALTSEGRASPGRQEGLEYRRLRNKRPSGEEDPVDIWFNNTDTDDY